MTRLLIVEDDLALRTGLTDTFRGEGHDVTAVADGEAARELLFGRHFDLVILDLMLPGRGGLEILRELRGCDQRVPVLVLTARGDVTDRVLGLELGADDYVTKPFSRRELVARVKAMLRRAGAGTQEGPRRFTVGAAEVDLEAFEVTAGDTKHALSPKEAAMLALLFRQQGKAVSRERFLSEVWGGDELVGPRTIDTHVLNLRRKLEPDPADPCYIRTVHGVGYALTLP